MRLFNNSNVYPVRKKDPPTFFPCHSESRKPLALSEVEGEESLISASQTLRFAQGDSFEHIGWVSPAFFSPPARGRVWCARYTLRVFATMVGWAMPTFFGVRSTPYIFNNLKKFLLCFTAGALIAGGSISKKANAEFLISERTKVPNINSEYGDLDPCISTDGLELYFRSSRPGGYGNWDIWVAKRDSVFHPWKTPVNLGKPVNDEYHIEGPSISADGLKLYFSSSRPGVLGWEGVDTDSDIWVTKRTSKNSSWQTPTNLGELALVNSTYFDLYPSISADDSELYFASDRPTGPRVGGIFIAKRDAQNNLFKAPENFWQINQKYVGTYPNICYDGLTFYAVGYSVGSSLGRIGYGGLDIFVSRRTTKNSNDWSVPKNLGPNVNSGIDDFRPYASADGQTLYFNVMDLIIGNYSSADLFQVSITPILDFNRDGEVDSRDWDILNSHLGEQGASVKQFDIFPSPIGDEKIDERDLEVFLENYNKEYNLMAHWQLDETEGNIAHDRISGWNGVLNGGRVPGRNGNPIWAPEGKINGALLFDGRNDYVSTPFVWNPSFGAFSVFTWIYGGNLGQAIISQTDGTVRDSGKTWLGLSLERKLMTTLTDGRRSGGVLASDLAIEDDKWSHVGFVWDGSRRALYINGKQVATDAMSLGQLIDSNGGLYFGADKNLSAGSFWNGLIDDIRIYNKALAVREIRRLAGTVENKEGFETGNFDNFYWRHYGNANWMISTLEKNSGTYSARSGLISNNESSSLEVTLNCISGDISFYRKVSSELGWDTLKFCVDGVEKGNWSGELGWQKVSYSVAEGTHTFTWTYSKDEIESRGYDSAWLDDVEFPVR